MPRLKNLKIDYFEHISNARAKVKERDEVASNTTIRDSQIRTPCESVGNHIEINNTKLPPLELKKFAGNPDGWLTFCDSFKSAVHNNGRLTDFDKLRYLQAHLTGSALKVIDSVETTAANYEVAWKLLEEQYDNRRIIIQTHTKCLMEMPSIAKEGSYGMNDLLNDVLIHMRALKILGQPVESWGSILIYIITSLLDRFTHLEWEKSLSDSEIPSFESSRKFIKQRYNSLNVVKTQTNPSKNQNSSGYSGKRQVLASTQSRKDYCNYCKGKHKIYACISFQKLSVPERILAAQSAGLCENCLRKGHLIKDCTMPHCKKCPENHNTLLHPEGKSNNLLINSLYSSLSSQVILATAIIDFESRTGERVQARVVLDSGSQSHFVTQHFATLLDLKYRSINIPVEGLNQIESRINYSIDAKINSRHTEFTSILNFLIIPNICNKLPTEPLDRSIVQPARNIKLADPSFHVPAGVDALLGAEIFYELLCIGRIRIEKQNAAWQKTLLGWILTGKTDEIRDSKYKSGNLQALVTVEQVNKKIAQFWEIEEIRDSHFLSDEEKSVEDHYVKNVRRKPNGVFVVRLPFNDKKDKIGESYKMAERRLLALERKFAKNESLKLEYIKFMREYESMGHMHLISKEETSNVGFFLPHHAVVKESSLTTKVRVVFDASAKSSSGISLNDALKKGPTVQSSLFDIIIRARTKQIIITADIEKMYRMIEVDERDTSFQRILWREDPSATIKIFIIDRLVYGFKPSSFLATRSLNELASTEREEFPVEAEIIEEDTYVDDVYSGADTREEAIRKRDNLIKLAKRGGFNLRQWCSNDPEVINSLPDSQRKVEIFSDASVSIKTLGIQWDPQMDELTYTINEKISSCTRVTKRIMLSQIAELFDPIGLLGPVIVKAKILM